MPLNEREAITLAGLLHDIGKFKERARVELEERYLKMESEICPVRSGKYSHRHVLWTYQFIDKYLPDEFKTIENIGCDVALLAASHHKPAEPYESLRQIIQKADLVSSGVDRRDRDEVGQVYHERLHALFGYVSLTRNNHNQDDFDIYQFELNPLKLDKDVIFPKKFEKEYLKENYRDLWDKFLEEFKKLPGDDFGAFFNSLYFLLEKYTWCIPSAVWKTRPDVSLFDHLKSSSAIALSELEGGNCLIIGGDISGVQNFIYDVASPQQARAQMAKQLRGRSFYLRLLNESLNLYILNVLELPIVNSLWCSGGQFTIIATDNEEIRNRLKQAGKVINEWLFEQYQASLYLALSWISVTDKELQNFDKVIYQLISKLTASKQRKFHQINTAWSFPLKDDVCIICGSDYSPTRKAGICAQCIENIEIGEALPSLRDGYICLQEGGNVQKADVHFEKLGIGWYFNRMPEPGDGKYTKLKVNNTDFGIGNSEFGFRNLAKGFYFLSNIVPLDEQGNIISFDEIAQKASGARFLGVLKMDVDDLGAVFAVGLAGGVQDDRSISRTSTLSRTIDYFFRGYLNLICQEYPTSYITYSGGDDLFIVGTWDEMLELSQKINREFSEYTCHNSDMRISAGLFLCKGKFPIGRAANNAGRLLNIAKSNEDKSRSKNSLAIFDSAIFWDDYLRVKEFADKCVTFIEEDKLSRSFIYKLLNLSKQYFGKQTQNVFWLSKFRYFCIRDIKDESVRAEIFKLSREDYYPYIPFLASYVLMKTRNA
jgi:CRISPR-associated protein Csm1